MWVVSETADFVFMLRRRSVYLLTYYSCVCSAVNLRCSLPEAKLLVSLFDTYIQLCGL